MKNNRQFLNQRGFVLIVCYLIITLVAIFAFAYFARSNAFQIAAERNQNKLVAFNMAESAVDATLVELLEDINYPGTDRYTSLDTDFVKGGYTVTVTTPEDNENMRIIQATGYSPDNSTTSRAYQTTTITAYAETAPDSLFNFAVFADNSLTISTSATADVDIDSYDSRIGDYGGSNIGSNADIGTNSIDTNCIVIKGGATTVKGDATIGPDGDIETAVDVHTRSIITGNKSSATEPQTLNEPSTDVPVSPAVNLTNSTLTLTEGTYHYASLSITASGEIVTTGEVKIYVDGDVNIGGNGIVNEGSPPNLVLYATGDSTVTLSGNSNFYGGIYAPNSLIKNTGGGSLYGAVVAEDYQQQGGGSVHFDEAMNDVAGLGSESVHVKSWREETSLAWNTGTAPSGS